MGNEVPKCKCGEGDDQDQNISHIKCQLPNHIIAPISNKIIDMPKTQWTINLHMGTGQHKKSLSMWKFPLSTLNKQCELMESMFQAVGFE